MQRDETVQRDTRTAELAWLRRPTVSPVANAEAEGVIAELSAEQTVDEMYRTAVEVRLDLIYCPTLDGGLRKRWANRLGDINLSAPAAAAEGGKVLAGPSA